MKRLKWILLACCLASHAPPARAGDNYMVLGRGTQTCKEFIIAYGTRARVDDYWSMTSWINGYITAYNSMSFVAKFYTRTDLNDNQVTDLTQSTTLNEMFDWTLQWCKGHMDAQIVYAAEATLNQLLVNLAKNAKP